MVFITHAAKGKLSRLWEKSATDKEGNGVLCLVFEWWEGEGKRGKGRLGEGMGGGLGVEGETRGFGDFFFFFFFVEKKQEFDGVCHIFSNPY